MPQWESVWEKNIQLIFKKKNWEGRGRRKKIYFANCNKLQKISKYLR